VSATAATAPGAPVARPHASIPVRLGRQLRNQAPAIAVAVGVIVVWEAADVVRVPTTSLFRRGEGWAVNVKRVYRLWRQEGLKVPSKTRKRRGWGTSANACHVRRAEHKDHVWTWDFVFDRTSSGTTLKWLSIMDEHTRECLALKVARSITSEDVIDTLAELFAMRGVPRCVRSDNGPEFIAQAIGHWFAKTSVTSLYIEPGAPWENGYAESFHSRLRDEFLGLHAFGDLREARTLTAAWREDYNHRRPHSSLGYQTPAGFAAGGANSVRATPSLRRHPRQSKEPLPVT